MWSVVAEEKEKRVTRRRGECQKGVAGVRKAWPNVRGMPDDKKA